nr:MAG TPA: hypothetical protein [Caudoviricetes sp.]
MFYTLCRICRKCRKKKCPFLEKSYFFSKKMEKIPFFSYR